MNILIEVTPKEIADLVREVQGQPTLSIDSDVIANSLQLATRDIAKAVSMFSEKKYKSRPVAGKLERLISAPFVPDVFDPEIKRLERYIVRALRYIHKSLKQGEQFELVIRDRNGNLVKKYKSRPVAGRSDC